MNKQISQDLGTKVSTMADILVKWFEDNPSLWRPEVDEYIEKLSRGKLRVFQTFFNNPYECLSGAFNPQVLEEKDVKAMYPKFEGAMRNLPQDTYCYIFCCNGALEGGSKALIMQTHITINK